MYEDTVGEIHALAQHMRRQRRPVVVDLFAGGGGASEGIRRALGVEPVLALNHDPAAIAMHRANHPDAIHITEDVFVVIPARFRRLLIDLLWASPSCTHFSRARGGKPVRTQLRTLGWAVVQWAQQRAPRVICVENVAEMLGWGPLYESGDLVVTGYRKSKTRTEAACIVAKVGTLTPRRGEAGLAAWARRARAAGLQVERVPVLREPGKRAVRLRFEALQFRSPIPLGLARRQRLARHLGQPIPERKGETFRDWVHALEIAGYRVEWRQLAACDHGAPTTRKRLFVVARRDRVPIRWPEPTHGPGLLPYRTAAECIDWSLPCPSIFARKKPLAPATLRRVVEGIRRYVLNGRPFLVNMSHGGRVELLEEPARTLTATPVGGDRVLVAPVLTRAHGHGWDRAGGPSTPAEAPLPTLTATDEHALATGHLVKLYGKSTTADLADPTPTVTGTDKLGLAAVFLDKMRGSARAGQPIDQPAPTATAGGEHQALVAACVVRHNGTTEGHGNAGKAMGEPLGAVTAVDTHGLMTTTLAPCLISTANGEREGQAPRARPGTEPHTTVTATGSPGALVAGHLVAYYGSETDGQALDEALRTVPTKDRFGHVRCDLRAALAPGHLETALAVGRLLAAHGVPVGPDGLVSLVIDDALYVLVDIGLRMLSPRELARAQGFGDDYQLTGTRSQQIARAGNSVSPWPARALVASLFADELAGIWGRSMALRARTRARPRTDPRGRPRADASPTHTVPLFAGSNAAK